MFNHDITVDTPRGRGKLIKYYYHKKTKKKMAKVRFTRILTHRNKRGKTIYKATQTVRHFQVTECTFFKNIPWWIRIWKGISDPSSVINEQSKQ
jgi:hypothetical protein